MPHYMETNASPPGDILKHMCILDYQEIIATRMVAILELKLRIPTQSPTMLSEKAKMLILHAVRTQQAAKRAKKIPTNRPHIPRWGGVGIHFDLCIIIINQ